MGTLAEDTAVSVCRVLGFNPDAPTVRVLDAADAALEAARTYIDPVPIEPPGDPLEAVPDTPLVRSGLTALAVRLYQAPSSPAGIMGSEGFTGAYLPEDLFSGVRHHFDPYRAPSARGIA